METFTIPKYIQPEHPYDNNSIYQGTSYVMKERKFISNTSSMIHKYILAKHFQYILKLLITFGTNMQPEQPFAI